MNSILICASIVLTIASLSYGDKYCDFQRKYCINSSHQNHIGCNNNGKLKCSNAKVLPITAELKNAFIDEHNNLRNKVASGNEKGYNSAARMATMTWDDELAYLAELNVKTCNFDHDCRFTDAYPMAGQSIYQGDLPIKERAENIARHAVQNWYSEYKYANKRIIEKYIHSKKYGHFTAIVTEKNFKLGCAILFRKNNPSYDEYTITCNYAFANLPNVSVYTSGKPASKCETGTDSKYTALCSVNEAYKVTW